MAEKMLLEIIVVLLGVLIAVMGWLFKKHDRQHDELKLELAAVKNQRETCTASFATKGAMERAHKRIDEQDEMIQTLGTRVTRIEACGGKP